MCREQDDISQMDSVGGGSISTTDPWLGLTLTLTLTLTPLGWHGMEWYHERDKKRSSICLSWQKGRRKRKGNKNLPQNDEPWNHRGQLSFVVMLHRLVVERVVAALVFCPPATIAPFASAITPDFPRADASRIVGREWKQNQSDDCECLFQTAIPRRFTKNA